jgi:hypothetical protein
MPYKAGMRPGVCAITLTVLLSPAAHALAVKREVEEAVRASQVEAEVEMHQAYPGYEAKGVEGLVGVTRQTFERLFDARLEICDPPYCSVKTDTNTFNENGIPCIKLGIGLSAEERLKVGNDAYDCHAIAPMVKGARLYALLPFEICNRAGL